MSTHWWDVYYFGDFNHFVWHVPILYCAASINETRVPSNEIDCCGATFDQFEYIDFTFGVEF